jgi:hypothetical protein
MTDELKSRIMTSFLSQKGEMYRDADGLRASGKVLGERIYFPFITDNVIDTAVYDVKSGVFTELIVEVCDEPSTPSFVNQHSGYSDSTRKERIVL